MVRADSPLGAALGAAPWVAVTLLLAYRTSAICVVDPDLFHQLAIAREWLATGTLPRVDAYAFTPTLHPVMHHELGAGVLALAVARALGGAGILALRSACALGLAAVSARTALRLGASGAAVLLLAIVAIPLVELGYLPVRAQAYSFLLAAAVLDMLERDRAGERGRLWLVVPLFVLWVNLHGGFVVGLALVALHLAERLARREPAARVAVLAVVLVAAVAVNPYGVAYYEHMVRSLSTSRALVPEWDPIWSPAVPAAARLAFASALVVLGYALAFGRARPLLGIATVAATALVAARHHRMLPFFAAAWFAYCPPLLRGSALGDGAARTLRRRAAPIAAVSAALAIWAALALWRAQPWHLRVPNAPLRGDPSASPYYPVGAVNFLRARGFEGNLLTPFGAGSYVSWKLHPAVRVSLDSRFEAAYPYAVVVDIMGAYATGAGVDRVLRTYAPDLVLVPRLSALAATGLPWPAVYRDPEFSLHARPGLALAPATDPVPLSDAFP